MLTFLIIALVVVPVVWALGYREGKVQGQLDAYSTVAGALAVDPWAHIDVIRF